MELAECPYMMENMTLLGSRPLVLTRHRLLYHAPEFEQRLNGLDTIEEGCTVKFSCKVVGLPKPRLRWFQDETEITDNPRMQIEREDDGECRLILECVNKGDEGAYKCFAENAEGSSSSTLYLTVKGKRRRRRKKARSSGRRQVSYSPFIPTIVERMDEEFEEDTDLVITECTIVSSFYDEVNVNTRLMPPKFLGQWAFAVTETDKNGSAEDGGHIQDESIAVIGESSELSINDLDQCEATDDMVQTPNNLADNQEVPCAADERLNGDLYNLRDDVAIKDDAEEESHHTDDVYRSENRAESLRVMIREISRDFEILARNDRTLPTCRLAKESGKQKRSGKRKKTINDKKQTRAENNTSLHHSSSNSSSSLPNSRETREVVESHRSIRCSLFTQFHLDLAFLLSAYIFVVLCLNFDIFSFVRHVLIGFVVYSIIYKFVSCLQHGDVT